jgi:hypothetical protein
LLFAGLYKLAPSVRLGAKKRLKNQPLSDPAFPAEFTGEPSREGTSLLSLDLSTLRYSPLPGVMLPPFGELEVFFWLFALLPDSVFAELATLLGDGREMVLAGTRSGSRQSCTPMMKPSPSARLETLSDSLRS